MPSQPFITYSDALARQRGGFLRDSEIPVEHTISLPLPTRRGGEPAFAAFAASMSGALRPPFQQSAPDRWWLTSAYSGRLRVYALCQVVPLASESALAGATLPAETRTLAQVRADADALEQAMNALVPAFFAEEPGDPEARHALSAALAAHLPEPILPHYLALAPDFFAWLDAGVEGEPHNA